MILHTAGYFKQRFTGVHSFKMFRLYTCSFMIASITFGAKFSYFQFSLSLLCEFFIPMLAGVLSEEYEWDVVSSSTQDTFEYVGHSPQCCSLWRAVPIIRAKLGISISLIFHCDAVLFVLKQVTSTHTHKHTHTHTHIYIYIIHHHVELSAQVFLTILRHASLSSITFGRTSGLHFVSALRCCM